MFSITCTCFYFLPLPDTEGMTRLDEDILIGSVTSYDRLLEYLLLPFLSCWKNDRDRDFPEKSLPYAYLIFIFFLRIFGNEILNLFFPPVLPVLGHVVVELHVLIAGYVCQPAAGHRFFVLDWTSCRAVVLRNLNRINY